MKLEGSVVFISGANRGIGLELVRQLSARSCRVVAGYRTAETSQLLLEDLGQQENVHPVQVDVTHPDDLVKVHSVLAAEFGHLDLLMNNAGINLQSELKLHELDWTDYSKHLDVNVGGVFRCTKALYPLLQAGAGRTVVSIGSGMGSIEQAKPWLIPYSVSKTALNMLTRQQAMAFAEDGVTVVSVNPGWVRTDMGGAEADLSVEESVGKLLKIIENLNRSQSGQFLNIDGSPLPY